jgi:hypothetical protein
VNKEEEEEEEDDDDGYRPHCPYVANPDPGSTSSITLLLLLQHCSSPIHDSSCESVSC